MQDPVNIIENLCTRVNELKESQAIAENKYVYLQGAIRDLCKRVDALEKTAKPTSRRK